MKYLFKFKARTSAVHDETRTRFRLTSCGEVKSAFQHLAAKTSKKTAPDNTQTRVYDEEEWRVKPYCFLVADSVTFAAAFFFAESVAFFLAPETVVLGLVTAGFVAAGNPALA